MLPEEIKRRVNSNRWEAWDYGASAAYFVTANTHQHKLWFATIEDQLLIHNEFGQIAMDCWQQLPTHFKDIELGVYVVMPNQVHGIIHLLEDHITLPKSDSMFESPMTRRRGNQGANTVSSMVGSFKSAVTKEIRQLDDRFAWQARFHDRVIRT